MKKFVMIDSHTLPSDYRQEREMLEGNGVSCLLAKCATVDAAVAAASDAQVIGTCYFKVDQQLLDRLPGLRAVIRYGIGYDVVDVPACSRRGILVCNLPTYCVEDVAAHAMAMLLDMSRKLTLLDRQARAGNWDTGYGYKMRRLSSLTLGLIGFGNTARLFRGYVSGFGMEVIACDPLVDCGVFADHGVRKVSFDELLAESDVLSLHVPIIPSTRYLINKDSLAKMRDGTMIINTARGPLIKLDDLVEALRSGKVRAAGLDVFEGEPITDLGHPIYSCENLIITPHVAYASVESEVAQHAQVAETALRIFAGEVPANTVNRAALAVPGVKG